MYIYHNYCCDALRAEQYRDSWNRAECTINWLWLPLSGLRVELSPCKWTANNAFPCYSRTQDENCEKLVIILCRRGECNIHEFIRIVDCMGRL